ncbi:rhombosortase [Vibrio hannami]|uniref:rhombosortase n=1 Tax=Vibrio hannami TaxID=2717094 RepID=UPI00240ED472|nr:rhombosortase [Vibrio hannami]MDG3087553.1 rhombosortase [Vibrio hannami]
MNLYLLLFLTTILSALFQTPFIQSLTIWNSQLIVSGEWWRIVSGNFTHTNIYHLILNTSALWIIAYLFKPKAKSLNILLLAISAFVGMCLLMSDTLIYAGLSGVLHGIFAYYAMKETVGGRKTSALLVLGVIAKVGYEQVFGASESTAQLIGARVAIEAHLAGCISGIVIFCLVWLWRYVHTSEHD